MKRFFLLLTAVCISAGSSFSAEPRFPEKESGWGICGNFTRWASMQTDQEVKRDRLLGVDMLRMDFDWMHIEPKRGVFHWQKVDRAVAAARRNGLQILGIIDKRVPLWEKNTSLLQNKEIYLNYLRKIVTRYKNDIRYWEVLNEPDVYNGADRNGGVVPAEDYPEILKLSYKTIKSIDPGLTVVFGSAGKKILEPALQAGMADYCDVWNLHCYNRVDPELRVGTWLGEYKDLYKKHNAFDREIWITETGRPTSYRYPRAVAVRCALEYLKINPEKCGILTLYHPDFDYASEQMILRAEDIGDFKKIRQIRTGQLDSSMVKEYPLLMIYDEFYPRDDFQKIVDYVRKGGTLLCLGGVPFHSEVFMENGKVIRRGGNAKKRCKDLHIGIEMWWTPYGKAVNLPKFFDKMEPDWDTFPLVPGLDFKRYDRGPHEDPLFGALRFLTETNLKPGDTFVPMLWASWKNGKKYPVAGIYQFDSELKGNIFAFLPHYMPFQFPHTGDDQARLLVRDALLLRGMGCSRIFPYRLHQAENGDHPEQHYGLCHRDFRPKPAYFAYQNLIRMCPKGSTRIQLTDYKNGAWTATWVRPDNIRITAVWTRVRPQTVTLTYNGKLRRVRDYLGNIVSGTKPNAFRINSGVLYLEGPANVKLNNFR
ncbi:MAG: cellulase family glycosylhydrolase [Lentisphaeria bacterium]|nr:cellulase family glycosylhydrolase [Lentisphaeria bacterium]